MCVMVGRCGNHTERHPETRLEERTIVKTPLVAKTIDLQVPGEQRAPATRADRLRAEDHP